MRLEVPRALASSFVGGKDAGVPQARATVAGADPPPLPQALCSLSFLCSGTDCECGFGALKWGLTTLAV